MLVWPTGIRAKGNGIEIRYSGKSKYLAIAPPYSEAKIRKAVKVRTQWIETLKYGIQDSVAVSGDSAIFAEVAQRYLDFVSAEKNWSIATRQGNLNILLKYWMPEFENYDMNAITYDHIDRYWEQVSLGFNTKKTQKNVLSPFKGVWSFAFRKNLVRENLAERFKVYDTQTAEIDAFTYEEKETILANMHPDAYAYWVVAFDTGMRTPSEVCALDWSDYDGKSFNVHTAIVRRQMANRTKTKRSRRVVVTQRIKDVLAESGDRRFKRGPIFLNGEGTRLKDGDWQNKHFYEACKAGGVRIRRPYNVRHTFATLGLDAGIPDTLLAKHLGHTVLTFHKHYGRRNDQATDDDQLLAIGEYHRERNEAGNEN